MASVNKVILIGNAVRAVELRKTESGKAVADLRLATNRKDGAPQFHSVVCWEGLAETVSQYVRKGKLLYVEGRIQYREFEDNEGQTRHATEIVAHSVQFLSPKQSKASDSKPGKADKEEHD